MPLSDSQKKKLSDLALGKSVSSKITTDDQIAACRKQIDLILAANLKIPVDEDYAALSTVVAAEKAKRDKKATTKVKDKER